MKTLFVALVACFVLLTGAAAQVTNQGVVKMVKAGVSDEIVISTIANSKGNTFDVSPDAIVALVGDGVSQKVISAMLAANQPKSALPTQETNRVAPVGTLKVPDGTPINVLIPEKLNPKNLKQNGIVKCEAMEDVKVGDDLLFAKGAPAHCVIPQHVVNGGFLQGGAKVLDVKVEYVTAVDGTRVRVKGEVSLGNDPKSPWKIATLGGDKAVGKLGKLMGRRKEAPQEQPQIIEAIVDGDKEIKAPVKLTASNQ